VEGRVYDVQVLCAINPPKRCMRKCAKWNSARVLFI
jgi:hypothetical protein